MSILRKRPNPEGSVWDVVAMSPDAWGRQTAAIWRDVQEEVVRLGYPDRCQRALQLHGRGGNLAGNWLDFPIALTAAELGAPIGQLFTACTLRTRSGE